MRGSTTGTLEELERSLLRLRRLREARMKMGILPDTHHSQSIARMQDPARRLRADVEALVHDLTIHPDDVRGDTTGSAHRSSRHEDT